MTDKISKPKVTHKDTGKHRSKALFSTKDLVSVVDLKLLVERKYTVDELLERYNKTCDDIACSDDTIDSISSRYDLSYYYLHRLADKYELFRERLEDALTRRAVRLYDKCLEIVDNIEEFWDAPVLDVRGDERLLRKERVSAVNRAKLQIDHYERRCAMMCPMLFGDKSKEIKEIQKSILELKAKLEGK